MKTTLKHQRIAAPSQHLYAIEKGVPMPPTGGQRQAVYRFDKMEVGDSFPLLDSSDPMERDRVRSAASYYGMRHHMKFSIRVSNPATKALRCWRTA